MYNDVIQLARDRVNDTRRLLRMLEQPEMEGLWDRLTPLEQQKVLVIIKTGTSEQLELWLRERIRVEDRTIAELRELAIKAGIKNWSRKDKYQLIAELQK